MGGRSVASRIARRDLPPPQGSTGADNGGRKAFHEKPPRLLIPVSAKGLAGTRQCQRAHPRTYAAIIRRRASQPARPSSVRFWSSPGKRTIELGRRCRCTFDALAF
ncbi:uncharacterized protein LOC123447227 [Hordeum vulgare subsp. vulgare]|uniref:Predicted protein n=1 Tax=Hordeum vulgare subsp. vulgare TaxID=112509 RepID=F2EE50_HORVV|nr:uncharacterized protein LOC123447227 [Hordeum vulgare subsp. vulgare]BAK05622.1 predicted protein [Hordeum vulgare subsp. vulgare]